MNKIQSKKVLKKTHPVADLHTHLIEKKLSERKWWRAVKSKSLCAVAITEHSEYNPKKAFERLSKRRPANTKKIILIPGAEVTTKQGHLLVYGADESIYDFKEITTPGSQLEDVLKVVKKNNFVASFSHPFGYESDSVCTIIGEKETLRLAKKYNVGCERYNGMLGSATSLAFNAKWIGTARGVMEWLAESHAFKKNLLGKKIGNLTEKYNTLALGILDKVKNGMEFSEKLNFYTAGSDAHYPHTIGRAVIEFNKTPKNAKEALEMIRRKKIKWAGPNIYLKKPVEHPTKKQIFEGLKYLTKKNKRIPKLEIFTKFKNKIFWVKKGIKRGKE
jgi:hypothetical protein